MISLRRPTQAQAEAYRSEHASLAPSTPPAADPPPGYRSDAFRRVVGSGADDFAAACEGLRRWAAHGQASVTVVTPDAPLAEGTTVGLVMRQPGLWILASCRITEVVDEPDRFGFVYATLPGHLVDGYESFIVTNLGDLVVFEVEMVARPASLLTRCAGPVGRFLQRRAVDGYLTGIESWVARSDRDPAA